MACSIPDHIAALVDASVLEKVYGAIMGKPLPYEVHCRKCGELLGHILDAEGDYEPIGT